MGGEFFLQCAKNLIINQTKWEQVLKLITADIYMRDTPGRNSKIYAFEYVDPKACFNRADDWDDDGNGSNDPYHKNFKINWTWSEMAIENELGGRSRSDWSIVRRICERLCDNFPGQFALVVCDGFSGCDDEDGNIYYDGIGRRYKKVDYNYWPWKDKMRPSESIVRPSGSIEGYQHFALDKVKIVLPDEKLNKIDDSGMKKNKVEATTQTVNLARTKELEDAELLQQYRGQFAAMERIIQDQQQQIKQQRDVIAVLLKMQQSHEQVHRKRKVHL